MKKKNIYLILIVALGLFFGLNYANSSFRSNLSSSQSSTSSVGLKEVEQQTTIFKEKQKDIDKLKEQLTDNSVRQIAIDSNKTSLISKVAEVDNTIQKWEINLTQEKQKLQELQLRDQSRDPSKDQSLDSEDKKLQEIKVNDLSSKLKDKLTFLLEIKAELESKNTELKNLQSTQLNLQSNLNSKSQELNGQFSNVINTIILLASNYVVYIILLVVYWALYKTTRYLIHQDVHNPTFKSAAKSAAKIIWILISVATIFYGLAGQFSYILTSLGFVSAALVFALQNFVVSLFVYLVISVTRIFKEGDIIKVGASFEIYTGRIISIGRFYTFIKEISPENHEELGRTVSIPNSFLLVHPVTNYTTSNQVIWLNLRLVVKEGSNQSRVKQILEYIADQKFKFVKENLVEFLDVEADINNLKPKVIMSLEEKGFLYNMHFPVRYDKYNEVYSSLLGDIILAFEQEDIHFAFKN
jgi:small-conductance mechanosensitive channel